MRVQFVAARDRTTQSFSIPNPAVSSGRQSMSGRLAPRGLGNTNHGYLSISRGVKLAVLLPTARRLPGSSFDPEPLIEVEGIFVPAR